MDAIETCFKEFAKAYSETFPGACNCYKLRPDRHFHGMWLASIDTGSPGIERVAYTRNHAILLVLEEAHRDITKDQYEKMKQASSRLINLIQESTHVNKV